MTVTTFRPYAARDADRCAALAADVWPIVRSVVATNDLPRFMRLYLDVCRPAATRSEVACLDGQVAGFLLGSVRRDVTLSQQARMCIALLKAGLQLFLGRYGRVREPLQFAQRFLATEAKAQQLSTGSGAEVVLFVVGAQYQGLGLGRALLDRFVAAARQRGARLLTLYTDLLSNWKFYERYGFTRRATFVDDLDTYFRGERTEGFVYELKLSAEASV
jgi:GNAT superfamily N-acetyltransferase